jgi:hypothetical protein
VTLPVEPAAVSATPSVRNTFRSRLAIALCITAASFVAATVSSVCSLVSGTSANQGAVWLTLASLFAALGGAAVAGAALWFAAVLVRPTFGAKATTGPLFAATVGFAAVAIGYVFNLVFVTTTFSGYSPANWALVGTVMALIGYLVVAAALGLAAHAVGRGAWTPPRAVIVLVLVGLGLLIATFSHVGNAIFYGHLDRFESALIWQAGAETAAAFASVTVAIAVLWAAYLVGRTPMSYQSLALPLTVVAAAVFVGIAGDTLAVLSGLSGWDLASTSFTMVSDVVEVVAALSAVWALGRLSAAAPGPSLPQAAPSF